jgi:uracil-DNA glycosylase
VSRPVDVLVQFLDAEQARGVTHVHLDDIARESLRELHERSKAGLTTPAEKPHTPPPRTATEAILTSTPELVALPAAAFEKLSIQGSTRSEQLDSLRRQAENWPPARTLGTLRDVMVFATGNPEARVMLVGEAPGYQEEKEREPFVGPAGQKMNDILKAMGLSREEVYISNIVKFRPLTLKQTTNNRKPSAEEMAACMPFIRAEISIVQPQLIIALGGTAAEGLLNLSGTVTSMRGNWHDFEGTPVRVSYHPSYLLQSGGSNPVKRQVWEDMLAVMEKLELLISEKQRGFFLPKL